MTTMVDLGVAIKSLIEVNVDNVMDGHTIKRVDYGDIDRVTESIQVCVEPETKRTEYRTTGRGVTRTYRIHVFVYFSFVTNPAFNREFCDRMAEAIEALLNTDSTLGGRVIDGLVNEVASGMSEKDGMAVRAARLTYEARAVDRLPMTG